MSERVSIFDFKFDTNLLILSEIMEEN
jgi:hypothetical protein